MVEFNGPFAARAPGSRIFEYACHKGHYAMPGILAGARAEERTAAEGGQ